MFARTTCVAFDPPANGRRRVMQAIRVLLTVAGMIVPDALIMSRFGWTGLAQLVLVGGGALITTALLVFSAPRHRRRGWRSLVGCVALIVWVALQALLLGNDPNTQLLIALLVILPGLAYLLLEALGLTPRPSVPGPLH